MKERALVNIDESCHSALLTGAHLEMREMTFMLVAPKYWHAKAYPLIGCSFIKDELFPFGLLYNKISGMHLFNDINIHVLFV